MGGYRFFFFWEGGEAGVPSAYKSTEKNLLDKGFYP